MENASKALLIAGAILIAIVLITLGVLILGKGQEVAKEADMSATEISAFNAKFTQFEGTRVRGTVVKQLYREVLQHNLVNDEGKRVNIKAELDSDDDTSDSIADLAKTGEKWQELPSLIGDAGRVYTVSPTYDTATGLVTTMTVTEK
ncbi:MAG: hypothetical protein IKF97_00980 [Clostridia bacterium]|nr:hypothetical protein [Clostridia bacterium]